MTTRSISDVVEFGCGDGHQLSLVEYPEYLGLDVSEGAIALCVRSFAGDQTKRFELYDPDTFTGAEIADLALSLDVILHLVEDDVFELHLQHLFQAARRYVVIYGSDVDLDRADTAAHVRFRRFLPHIQERFPSWSLERVSEGIAPAAEGPRTDFFVFQRV
ncbi:MAG: class I SAM-dependent methyltransferase [Acidimicrobiia bacterium]|nr:class I SAM-dependent methyltransferase [Acidimicrobiia bacterium]